MAERITITLTTENDAFSDEPATEIARILRKVADRFEEGDAPSAIHDVNANIVGLCVIAAMEG